jgi:type VI secretion system protein ImpH
MATQSRLDGAPLAAAGAPPPKRDEHRQPPWTDPNAFEFFQAVRLLTRLRRNRTPVGVWGDPSSEVVRFAVNPSVAFPASEIQSLVDPGEGPVRMLVNFFGLTGPVGVLPLNYTALLMERLRARDRALVDFFDIFHHRIISLMYRAWEKSRVEVAHERERLDRLSGHLKDLIGIGTSRLQDRLPFPDEALLFYTGLLALSSRPAAALEQLLEDYFDVPVKVEQFAGAWYPLDLDSQCQLGEPVGPSEQLGLGAVAGDEVWDQQARVRLRIGPLTREQYEQFLPTGGAYRPLRVLTRLYSGDQFDFEIQLVLVRDDVPGVSLGLGDDASPPLGWCTWLRTAPLSRDPDDTILTLSDGKAYQ